MSVVGQNFSSKMQLFLHSILMALVAAAASSSVDERGGRKKVVCGNGEVIDLAALGWRGLTWYSPEGSRSYPPNTE